MARDIKLNLSVDIEPQDILGTVIQRGKAGLVQLEQQLSSLANKTRALTDSEKKFVEGAAKAREKLFTQVTSGKDKEDAKAQRQVNREQKSTQFILRKIERQRKARQRLHAKTLGFILTEDSAHKQAHKFMLKRINDEAKARAVAARKAGKLTDTQLGTAKGIARRNLSDPVKSGFGKFSRGVDTSSNRQLKKSLDEALKLTEEQAAKRLEIQQTLGARLSKEVNLRIKRESQAQRRLGEEQAVAFNKEEAAQRAHAKATENVALIKQKKLGEILGGAADRRILEERDKNVKKALVELNKTRKGTNAHTVATKKLTHAEDKLFSAQKRLVNSNKKINAEMSKLSKNDKQAISSLTELSRVVAVMQGPLGPVAGRLTAMSSAIRNMGAKALATGLLMAGFIALLRKAVPAAIDLQRVTTLLTVTSDDGARALKFVLQESRRLGSNFLVLAKSYTKLNTAAKGTTLEGNKINKIFHAVNTASLALRLTVDQTRGAFVAIEQMISKGTVSSEELRQQLAERLPGSFRLAADAAGLTTAEFSKALKNGNILAEEVLPKLAEILEQRFGPAAAKAAGNLGTALDRLNNEFDVFLGKMISGGILRGFASSVDTITASFKQLEKIAAPLFGLIGVGFVSLVVKNLGQLSKAFLGVGGILKGFFEKAADKGAATALGARVTRFTAKFGFLAKAFWPAALGVAAFEATMSVLNADIDDQLAKVRGKLPDVLARNIETQDAIVKARKDHIAALKKFRVKPEPTGFMGAIGEATNFYLGAPRITKEEIKSRIADDTEILNIAQKSSDRNLRILKSMAAKARINTPLTPDISDAEKKVNNRLNKLNAKTNLTSTQRDLEQALKIRKFFTKSIELEVAKANQAIDAGTSTGLSEAKLDKLLEFQTVRLDLSDKLITQLRAKAKREAETELKINASKLKQLAIQDQIALAKNGSAHKRFLRQALAREKAHARRILTISKLDPETARIALKNRQDAQLNALPFDASTETKNKLKAKQQQEFSDLNAKLKLKRDLLTREQKSQQSSLEASQKAENESIANGLAARAKASVQHIAENASRLRLVGRNTKDLQTLIDKQALEDLRAKNARDLALLKDFGGKRHQIINDNFDSDQKLRDANHARQKRSNIAFHAAQLESDKEFFKQSKLRLKIAGDKSGSLVELMDNQKLARMQFNADRAATLQRAIDDNAGAMAIARLKRRSDITSKLLEENQKKQRDSFKPEWIDNLSGSFANMFGTIATGSAKSADAMKQLIGSVKQLIAQMLILSPLQKQGSKFLNIVGDKVSGLLGLPSNATGSGSGLTLDTTFHGGGTDTTLFGSGSSIPHFALGGKFTIPGTGGTDSQLVRFRGTPGERVTVTPLSGKRSNVSPLHGVQQTFNIDARGATPGMEVALQAAVEEGARRGYAMVADDFLRNGPIRQANG